MPVLSHKKNVLDEEVERVVSVMKDVDPSDDRYGAMAANLVKLSQARSENSRREIDPNVIIGAITNIVGILVILKYEKFDILTSKAINMIVKPRIV